VVDAGDMACGVRRAFELELVCFALQSLKKLEIGRDVALL
jgi:hypothetical protein